MAGTKNGTWNREGLTECKRCHRSRYMHRAHGLCVSCYNSIATGRWRKKVAAELKTLRKAAAERSSAT